MTRDTILRLIDTNADQGGLTEDELRGNMDATYDRIHNSVKRLVRAGILLQASTGKLNRPERILAELRATMVPTDRPLAPKMPILSGTVNVANEIRAGLGKAPPKPRRKITRILVDLDDSISMRGVAKATLASINRTFADIKDKAQIAADQGQEVTLSFYKFGSIINPIFRNWPGVNARPLAEYIPKGDSTKLFDSVNAIIEAHNGPADPDFFDPTADISYLLIVITDGKENDSALSEDDFRQLLSRVQGTDRWTTTFLLPPGYKRSFVQKYDVPEGNVEEWELNDRGVERTTRLRTKGLDTYFTARSRGETKVDKFYVETDLSKLRPETVRQQLTNIAAQVRIFEVKKEEDIEGFMQRNTGRAYERGTGFYQLTKKEAKIQPDKLVLIRQKGTKGVYAGTAARQMLGLPDGGDARVTPGNHSEYDVFVQAKSLNRKLVRGTNVVYWPAARV